MTAPARAAKKGAGSADAGVDARVTGVQAAPPAAPPDPAAPTVTARADRTDARVGDVIKLTVTAVGPRGTPVNLPSTIELPPFSLLDRKDAEKDLGDGRMQREFTLQVAAYEPGETAIPPVEVTYLGTGGDVRTARTQAVPIKITSLLANEPEPALKDNAAPVRVLEDNFLPLYVASGLAAAALGGVVALWLRRRLRARAAARPAPPPRPAHEIALERLDRLGAEGFAEGQDLRPFYFALSEIIRDYLGSRYRFDGLEMTTEELVDELRRRAPRALVMGEVAGWLSVCDLVKFAKVAPLPMEARGALETAIRIVESTRPRPEPLVGQDTGVAPPPQEAAGG